jgi:hypothetical protein
MARWRSRATASMARLYVVGVSSVVRSVVRCRGFCDVGAVMLACAFARELGELALSLSLCQARGGSAANSRAT